MPQVAQQVRAVELVFEPGKPSLTLNHNSPQPPKPETCSWKSEGKKLQIELRGPRGHEPRSHFESRLAGPFLAMGLWRCKRREKADTRACVATTELIKCLAQTDFSSPRIKPLSATTQPFPGYKTPQSLALAR